MSDKTDKIGATVAPRIIFLDVDGVLNSTQFFQQQRDTGAMKSLADHIDPAAVARLNTIVQRTGAKVVESSTRRMGSLFELLVERLKELGFSGEVIGKTGDRKCDECLRGNEILAWVKSFVQDYYNFNQYVIIDDDTDMLYCQRDNFVKTSSTTGGLTDEHVEQAVAILTRGVSNIAEGF